MGSLNDLHLWNLHDQHNRDIDHLINELQLGDLYSLLTSLDHGDLPLRHDRDVDDLDDELQLWNLTERVRPLQLYFFFPLHGAPRRRLDEVSSYIVSVSSFVMRSTIRWNRMQLDIDVQILAGVNAVLEAGSLPKKLGWNNTSVQWKTSASTVMMFPSGSSQLGGLGRQVRQH